MSDGSGFGAGNHSSRGLAGCAAEARSRLVPAAVWALVVWPGASILAAAWILGEQPLISSVRWTFRVTGATSATLYLLAELLACAAVLIVMNIVFWVVLSRLVNESASPEHSWYEPPLFGLFLVIGVASIYPAQLRHPLFLLFRKLPVAAALLLAVLILVLIAALVGWRRTGRKSGAAAFAAAGFFVMLLSGVLSAARVPYRDEGIRDSILLLGIDSLSQTQDLSIIRSLQENPDWEWFSHPVTPGLLTNSVWPAILMNRRVHETGCYLTFQNPNWDRSPYNMVEAAERSGFETWSFFSDQFTTYVGTNGGFKRNRSGPKGWLQPGTAAVKDASFLLPVMLPRLPGIPLARSPRNQSGTFAYDLERELLEIVTAGKPARPVFVAGHLDYLHQPAYPGMHELNRDQVVAVLKTPAGLIRDLSIHWQYPELQGEPIGIYSWKLRRIQRLLVDTLNSYELSDPARNNRIAIFSDHGPRTGIAAGQFSQKHLYKVPLITSGLSLRDRETPISLLDLHQLIGLPDPTRPEAAPAVVEYTFMKTLQEEQVVMKSSTMREDGEVELNPFIIARFGQELLAYYPHESHRGYVPVPAVPAEMDALEETRPEK